jgi:hypothetical protein
MKQNETVGACNMRGRNGQWLEWLKGKEHGNALGLVTRIILKLILEKGGLDGVEWIHLTQDRGKRWGLV